MMRSAVSSLILIVFLLSCSGFEGEFSVKRSGEDSYRKIMPGLEFSLDEEADWVFSLMEFRGSHKVGIVTMKKEAVWVDVRNDTDYIDASKRHIYGRISGFEPGEYEIFIVLSGEKNTILGRLPFSVYQD